MHKTRECARRRMAWSLTMGCLTVALSAVWGGCSGDGGGDSTLDNATANNDADGGLNNDEEGDALNDDVNNGVDVADDDLTPDKTFEESCIFSVVSCFGDTRDVLSCTHNSFTGATGIAFNDDRAEILTLDEQGRVIAEIYAEENICYGARAVQAGDEPTAWLLTVPGFERQPLEVAFEGDVARIVCLDGTTESYPAASVAPFMPELLSPTDPPCQTLDDSQCSVDIDCAGDADNDTCCAVVDTGRCLPQGVCPVIPTGLTGCLKETLNCFGARRSPLSCEIAGEGTTEVTYSANRAATISLDELRNITVSARNSLGECFTLTADGTPPWARADITNSNDGRLFPILFQNGRAFITCDEETTEQFPEDFVLRNLPTVLTQSDDLCAP